MITDRIGFALGSCSKPRAYYTKNSSCENVPGGLTTTRRAALLRTFQEQLSGTFLRTFQEQTIPRMFLVNSECSTNVPVLVISPLGLQHFAGGEVVVDGGWPTAKKKKKTDESGPLEFRSTSTVEGGSNASDGATDFHVGLVGG